MTIIILILILIGAFVVIRRSAKKRKLLLEEKLNQKFPELWLDTLKHKVRFYAQLDQQDKNLFEKRIQRFLLTKHIEGIDTEIDDTIKLMVASSAVIPTFAFPEYNYPDVQTVLIYPNSFDEHFQTTRYNGHKEFISGMVGNLAMNGTVILSKPDLVNGFDGRPHKSNVGIHEFVHLLDKEDGAIDGIPKLLIDHAYIGPWLHEIKKEMKKIEAGTSDINPYGLTNNAEFLAVASEYFFENPEKFERRHPELYKFMSDIFNRNKTTE